MCITSGTRVLESCSAYHSRFILYLSLVPHRTLSILYISCGATEMLYRVHVRDSYAQLCV